VTDLGVLGVGRLGAVDASGGLTPAGADWTLRWWIGSEDRWHVPPVEAAVRQTLVGDTPVVETRVRVVSGDIVHHAFAATGPGGAPTLVAEITNETPVPVAIGLVMDGAASVEVDGAMLTVDGLQVRLPRAPSEWVAPVAFLPLTHKATLRVVLAREAPEAADLPDAEQVAAGWRAQGDVGSCWALPEPTITAAADAARGFLVVHDEPDLATTAWLAEARHQLGLRDEQGFRSGLVTGQRLSGRIPDATDSEASTGQALVAFGWAIESDLIGPVAKAAHAIERRRRVRKHRKDPQRAGLLPAGPQPPILGRPAQTYLDDWWSVAGLVRAARLLEDDAQLEASVDAWRFARGLAADIDRSITAVLAAAPPVLAPGARARALLADVGSTGPDDNGVLAPDPVALAAETGASTSDGMVPAGPGRAVDAGIVGILVGTGLGAVDPEAPTVSATLDLIRDELTTATGGVTAGVLSDGWAPWLTALLARTEIGLGDGGVPPGRALAPGRRAGPAPPAARPPGRPPRRGPRVVRPGHRTARHAHRLRRVRLRRPLARRPPRPALGAGTVIDGPSVPHRDPCPRPVLVQHRAQGRGPPRPLEEPGRRRRRGRLLVKDRHRHRGRDGGPSPRARPGPVTVDGSGTWICRSTRISRSQNGSGAAR